MEQQMRSGGKHAAAAAEGNGCRQAPPTSGPIPAAVAIPGPLQASQRCTMSPEGACEPGAAQTRRQMRRFLPRSSCRRRPPLTWQGLPLPSAGPSKQPVGDQQRKSRLQATTLGGCWHAMRADGQRVVGGVSSRLGAAAAEAGQRCGSVRGRRGLTCGRKGVRHHMQCS
jgi:hypothetical protein